MHRFVGRRPVENAQSDTGGDGRRFRRNDRFVLLGRFDGTSMRPVGLDQDRIAEFGRAPRQFREIGVGDSGNFPRSAVPMEFGNPDNALRANDFRFR